MVDSRKVNTTGMNHSAAASSHSHFFFLFAAAVITCHSKYPLVVIRMGLFLPRPSELKCSNISECYQVYLMKALPDGPAGDFMLLGLL